MRSIFDLSLWLLLSLPVPSASLEHPRIGSKGEISLEERAKLADVIRHKLINHSPMGVRKLSDDEGEKFWLDYWQFVEDFGQNANASFLQPPYPLHGHILPPNRPRWPPRALTPIVKRSFECPVGSAPCTSIDRPNSCCSDGTVCQLIEDTGLGDVGCCPSGAYTCGGGIDTCPEDHSSCPDHPGGGCCIPGYTCFEEGCLSTVIVTASPTHQPPTSTSTSTSPTTTTTTEADSPTINPPWRPTSHPDTTTTSTSSSPVTTTTATFPEIPPDTGCPTGFYACSAVYRGGCCRTGRDCQATSCPAPTQTTIVDSNGATVVVPIESGPLGPVQTETGTCAEGWKSCAAEEGGGCCPDGYGCGWTSCTAEEKGETGSVGKIPTENVGAGTGVEWRVVVLLWMVVVLWSWGW